MEKENRNKKIIFRQDSRDKIYKQMFGQVIILPDEINFDTAQYDEVQPVGNVMCTAFTTCDIAEDQENKEFDILDLWNRIPSNQYGADPREVLKEAVANGLLVVGETERRKDWKSYWRADLGLKDSFDNLRSAIVLSNSPVGVATYWYSNWPSGEILPIGDKPVNGHMYSVEGWVQKNGQPHLIVEAWIGRKLYMSREVFNEAMKPYGMSSWVLATSEIDAKKVKTLTETVKDLIINLIIKLRELINTMQYKPITEVTLPTPPVPTQPEPPQPQIQPPTEEFPRYQWDTIEHIRKSIRIIADEEGLSLFQKNMACDICACESGFRIDAKLVNSPTSIDRGLFQWNSRYHPQITDEIAYNPEKNARLACQAIWNGRARIYWSASMKCWNKGNKYFSV